MKKWEAKKRLRRNKGRHSKINKNPFKGENRFSTMRSKERKEKQKEKTKNKTNKKRGFRAK